MADRGNAGTRYGYAMRSRVLGRVAIDCVANNRPVVEEARAKMLRSNLVSISAKNVKQGTSLAKWWCSERE
jgi:hypothetical protein